MSLLAGLTVFLVGAEAARAAPAASAGGVSRAASVEPRCTGPCAIAVHFKGNGAGRVTSNPAGLDCRSDCFAGFPETSTVTVRATPDPGSYLASLDGCPAVTADGTCEFVMADLFFICPAFVAEGSAAPPPSDCPPASAPPAPPPHGAPPAGSACTIIGSPGPDVISGTPGHDVICGRGGNDTIRGGADHDLILGSGGADRIYGQRGRDRIVGGAGNDRLDGGAGADSLRAGRGADLVHARDGVADRIDGGSGRDSARIDRVDTVRAVERRF